MALSAPRDTRERNHPRVYAFVVNAGATVFQGGLVAVNATGFAVPGQVATTLTAAGRAKTGGVAGDTVSVERGTFKWKNSASTDLITAADWGKPVYIVDDETVAKTNGSSTRSIAGTCRGVDTDGGVWVET